jgi:hypothetical protein
MTRATNHKFIIVWLNIHESVSFLKHISKSSLHMIFNDSNLAKRLLVVSSGNIVLM